MPGRVRLPLDYRLVLLGSLLPDLVDKPVSWWLWPEVTGRNLGHTGLLQLALVALGLAFATRGRYGLLVLALASAGHLLLDRMWEVPSVLAWPTQGISLRGAAEQDFSPWWIRGLYHLGVLPALDALGAVVLVAAFLWTAMRGRTGAFLRSGSLVG